LKLQVSSIVYVDVGFGLDAVSFEEPPEGLQDLRELAAVRA
jgi:hypothetical protein